MVCMGAPNGEGFGAGVAAWNGEGLVDGAPNGDVLLEAPPEGVDVWICCIEPPPPNAGLGKLLDPPNGTGFGAGAGVPPNGVVRGMLLVLGAGVLPKGDAPLLAAGAPNGDELEPPPNGD